MKDTRGQIHNRLENIRVKSVKELLAEREESRREMEGIYGDI